MTYHSQHPQCPSLSPHVLLREEKEDYKTIAWKLEIPSKLLTSLPSPNNIIANDSSLNYVFKLFFQIFQVLHKISAGAILNCYR